MFTTDPMTKLTVVGPHTVQTDVIETFYRLKVLHILDHKKDALDIGRPLAGADEISALLVKVRSLVSYLEKYNTKRRTSVPIGLSDEVTFADLERDCSKLDTFVLTRINKIQEVTTAITALQKTTD